MDAELFGRSPMWGNWERPPSEPLLFAAGFVTTTGKYAASARLQALASHKLDRTVVTDVDRLLNRQFIEAVSERSDGRDAVIGEEESAVPADCAGLSAGELIVSGHRVWVIDPVDGTGEYVDATLPDGQRTACVAVAMFEGGRLQLAAVVNPFTGELFAGERAMSAAYCNRTLLDVRRNGAAAIPFTTDQPYDYCEWDGAPIDGRRLERWMGHAPIGSYSAINQALDVARGRSAFAVFPGSTVHDIAPGALLVELAGGVVSDLQGRPLDWSNLAGAVYAATPAIRDAVVRQLGIA